MARWAFLKNRNLYLMLIGESGLFALALLVAYGLRFEFDIPPLFARQILELLPVAVLSKLAFFWIFGLYRGMWRYTGLADLWNIGKAITLAATVLVGSVLLTSHLQGHPRSIFLLDPLLAFLFACGARVLIRSIYEMASRSTSWQSSLLPAPLCPAQPGTRAFIVGADDDGARIAKQLLEARRSGLVLLGFVDDKSSRIGLNIHGLPVFGPLSTLPELILRHQAEEILVSATTAKSETMRRLVAACETIHVGIKQLPSVSDIASGKISIKTLRDVPYEDLLGRPEVHLDRHGIAGYLKDKTVLITGAGGSIGSELCRQVLRFEPRKLILFDAGEANLYNMEMELKHEHGFAAYVPILGQVQDEPLLDDVFARHAPQVVFHAAAYKHVPMLESNPWQAVTNNILGSQCVMATAARHKTERVVLVSTDKAVRPTNVMGASKRVAELLIREFQGEATTFMAVRFGNVLGSSGSVIPLFRRQIERGGPVTVTHPDVTRYFMTIPEAAQLILQAGALGRGGEIFLLKMGQPVRIADLARDLIVLSGKSVEDVPIHFTGLRPGEKLYEELITSGEGIVETGHDQIMVLRAENASPVAAGARLDNLLLAARSFDRDAIRRLLVQLVPEYHPAPPPGQDGVRPTHETH